MGKWPGTGPEGQPLDQRRSKRSGTDMIDSFAVVEYRGDWTLA